MIINLYLDDKDYSFIHTVLVGFRLLLYIATGIVLYSVFTVAKSLY